MAPPGDLERGPDPATPVPRAERMTNLDALRGIAVLGILLMNAVSFGLGTAPYYNLDAGGSASWLDWAIAGLGEVFVDQKFMGLFSLLFGAGIVLFADRAEARGRRPALLSLWRNGLLLVMGIAHTLVWEGDVLLVYALCAPVLIAVRRVAPKVLLTAGCAVFAISPIAAWAAQRTVDASGSGLGELWFETGTISDAVGLFIYGDVFARALGMMLIGVALHRTGVITGARPAAFYRKLAAVGLGIGIPLSAIGLAIVVADGFSPGTALVGSIPNSLATIPMTLGYVGLITLWNRGDGAARFRVRAVGQMALTNYLTQTVLGLFTFGVLLGSVTVTRTAILAFAVAVWAIQLWWSQAWLSRFRYGPAEWAWRCATYRRWEPLRASR